mgnify:CR=1 FL=1
MAPRRTRRPRPAPPPPPAPATGLYEVIGPQRVLGRRRGELVELTEGHARRLVRAGHVKPHEPQDITAARPEDEE